MTASSLARLLVRRWYLTVFGLVITGTLAILAASAVSPKYTASGDVLLIAPPSKASANPYLDLGSVAGVPSVLALAMSDDAARNAIAAAGAPGVYTVEPDSAGGGAVLIVTGKGATAATAIRSMQVAMSYVGPTLLRMQQELKVPTASLITSRTVQADTKATVVRKSQTRAVIGSIALGLVLTTMLVAGSEALTSRRRARARSGASRAGRSISKTPRRNDSPHEEPLREVARTPTLTRRQEALHGGAGAAKTWDETPDVITGPRRARVAGARRAAERDHD